MKQETLEEAAFNFTANKSIKEIQSRMDFVKGAVFGSKWQQERSYSEEEVKEIVNYIMIQANETEFGSLKKFIDNQFEQFKKE